MKRTWFRAWEINSQRWAHFSLTQLWTTHINPSDYEHWCESTSLFDCYGVEVFESDICVWCPEGINPLEALPFVVKWELALVPPQRRPGPDPAQAGGRPVSPGPQTQTMKMINNGGLTYVQSNNSKNLFLEKVWVTFVEVGLALARIRDRRFYKHESATFKSTAAPNGLTAAIMSQVSNAIDD